MTKPIVRKLRCAIYTRKSSEEGLEQEFNSLHAQREACEAYIASQRSEGWVLVRDQDDDGGISGGTLDRPGLQQLMADIEDGLIDVVVVYKIDRLSRSLADFAKLVEVFDRNDVTFVSVTQSFNTTTSMGRLTLNILLSFAQFEREVTAERIRDKVAASRKKGMWMGGVPPYGYRVESRKLVIDDERAAHVRWILARFLDHPERRQALPLLCQPDGFEAWRRIVFRGPCPRRRDRSRRRRPVARRVPPARDRCKHMEGGTRQCRRRHRGRRPHGPAATRPAVGRTLPRRASPHSGAAARAGGHWYGRTKRLAARRRPRWARARDACRQYRGGSMTSRTPIPDTVMLHVRFRVVKRGGRKEMKLPEDVKQPRRTDNTLVKAMARAFRWKRMLESAEFTTIAELAEREGIAPA